MARRVGSPSQPIKPPESDSASREGIDDDETLNTTGEEDVDLENPSPSPPPGLFTQAISRVSDAQVPRESQSESVNSPTPSTQKDVHRRVANHLSEASWMHCPSCGLPGLTDYECMHIQDEEPNCRVAQCCICQEDFPQPTMHVCEGTQRRHHICTDCYRDYLRAELAFGGAFEGTQHIGGNRDSTVVSEPGGLPCPVFLDPHDPCDCVSLPWEGMWQLLFDNPDIADDFTQAISRVWDAQVPRESQPGNINGPTPSTLQDVHRIVANHLSKASSMRCPSCGLPGLKDAYCMHIKCERPNCRIDWCYCCGRHRRRNDPEDCRGCDTHRAYLENNPGWGNFAMNGELPGDGARIEFHRQIMRYYIQRIRHETSSELWEAFRRAYPNILTDLPVRGRHISWEELNSPAARIPPLFGSSTEADLLWRLPPLAEDPRGNSDNEHTEDVESGGDSQRTDNRTNHVDSDNQLRQYVESGDEGQHTGNLSYHATVNFPSISEQVFHSRRGRSWLVTCYEVGLKILRVIGYVLLFAGM